MSVAETPACARDGAQMKLSDFATAGLLVAVRSSVLDEVVLFVSDNTTVDPTEKRVVYRVSELLELLVHEIKRVFNGTVVGAR